MQNKFANEKCGGGGEVQCDLPVVEAIRVRVYGDSGTLYLCDEHLDIKARLKKEILQ